jgi:hypothetical protein
MAVERAERAASRLENLVGRNSENRYVQVIANLLDLQHIEGCWGSDDYPVLKPVFTAQALMALELIGVPNLNIEGEYDSSPAARARDWLLSEQNDDGSWGEDAFDTCEVLKALHQARVPVALLAVRRGLEFLRCQVDCDWRGKESFWSGTGFIGSALEIFVLYADSVYSNRTLAQLSACFSQEEGRYNVDSVPKVAAIAAPLEWHNACALLGLRSLWPLRPEPEAFRSTLEWLKSVQSPEGCWAPGHDEITAICTYQVVATVTQVEEPQCSAALRAADWFVDQAAGTTTRIAGYNARFMAGAVVARTRAQRMQVDVGFVFLAEVYNSLRMSAMHLRRALDEVLTTESDLEALRSRTDELQQKAIDARTDASAKAKDLQTMRDQLDLSRSSEIGLQKEISRYALKLTANQLAVWGVVLTLITFFLGALISTVLAK